MSVGLPHFGYKVEYSMPHAGPIQATDLKQTGGQTLPLGGAFMGENTAQHGSQSYEALVMGGVLDNKFPNRHPEVSHREFVF